MAEPVDWHGTNKILNAPVGHDYIQTIKVFNNGTCSVSCWKLSPEELADIVQNGGHVFVGVMGGKSQAPMFVGNEESVRAIVVDTGKVWNKIIK